MEKTLKRLFDYQRFANNKRIADMIADTESRYNAAPLSDDMLELVSAAGARSQKLLGLFEKLYEDNVKGKVTDEWFMRLSQKYENEQEELKRQTLELKEKLDSIDRMQTAKDDFLKAIRKFMEMRTLTPVILRELIEKIEVFPVEGTGKNKTQKVIIHYRFVGTLDIPDIIHRPPYILDSRKGVAIEYLSNAV